MELVSEVSQINWDWLIIMVVTGAMGFAGGMYISSQIEKGIDKNIKRHSCNNKRKK